MAETYPTVREIAAALEAWAPPGSAQSYDNVGLQVGDPEQPVRRALLALDLTPAVLGEARTLEAELIITHHPLLFRPLRQLTPDGLVSSLALRLAAAGIALYSIHTNLDAAPGGVSFALAEHLGLKDVQFLAKMEQALYKLVTFVPASHFEQVREALAEAGAGRIGNYEACAFATRGTGYFRPGDMARPFIGEPGKLESAEELRLEVEVARWDLPRVLAAMRDAHPYEEVAYDVYPVEQPYTRAGLGAIGRLEKPELLRDFLQRVAERLQTDSLRYVGDLDASVETVAVCGGAGADLIGRALSAGADAYVTADLTYHRFFEVLDNDGRPRMALIDAGHYETEALTEALLATWLQQRFPTVDWKRTTARTSPVRTFIHRP
ncbi:Nif3-like dinuclear metal center hexameric protein [Rhodothermus marinus]|uniref:Nif3-like dinuclear metal center hexameric protein n=1 Tax=Rhodothermus marinus TaxID=29549 RepID=UPI0012BA44AE|nr:Nif3-like dinuclear metal center hexameric protein [Rhodothermus marinus]BBM70165.1 Nif3-like dinuclear metal center hexameric protein [Rhodothermus marinus]BBM73151.1 Nif3-like dinuclear metal center hexameric protein [Rhodothermus marinus]